MPQQVTSPKQQPMSQTSHVKENKVEEMIETNRRIEQLINPTATDEVVKSP